MTDNEQAVDEEPINISWYPSSVDECHELLSFYRRQMMVFKDERAEYEKIVTSLEMSYQEKHKLEWELHEKMDKYEEMKKQLSDAHLLLYQEKNQGTELASDLKCCKAELEELRQNKQHLLELLESYNSSVEYTLDGHRRHKSCVACTRRQEQRIVCKELQNQTHGRKLTTIYLPKQNDDTLQDKLNAKEEELSKLKSDCVQINQFLVKDRNEAYQRLEVLRDEYNLTFESQQLRITDLSKQHLFNLKEYLSYRRSHKQSTHDLQAKMLQTKQENDQLRQRHDHHLKLLHLNTNKMEKTLKKKSNKMIHEFRLNNMKKHQELTNVKDELMTLSRSYKFDVAQLKTKLTVTKKKNKRLHRINKCQKIGVQSDVEHMKKRLKKLQKTLNGLSIEQASGDYHASLQNEIDKVQARLLELAEIAEP